MTRTNRNSRRYDVLAAVRENPRASMRELCQMTGIKSTSVISYHLNKLEEEGVLTRDRNTARGIWLGGVRPEGVTRSRQYSPKNYEKKAAAGRKGRSASIHHTQEKDELKVRIDRIAERNKALPLGGSDVVRVDQPIRLTDLHGSKVW